MCQFPLYVPIADREHQIPSGIEITLTDDEKAALMKSAAAVQELKDDLAKLG